MKVAIFGASGLVGRSLRHILTEKGIDWIGTYNKSSFEGGYSLEKTDELSLQTFLKEHVITHCINCVAERNVDLCEKEWDRTHETNTMFPGRLAEVCKENNIYFLHISTDYVFDGSNAPYTPESQTSPIQAYGKSKALAEYTVKIKNPDACIVRVPVLYTHRYKNILETAVTMIGKKVLDKTKSYNEDDYFLRRPVFIDDLAVFCISLVEQEKQGLFHFYNPQDVVTKYQMATMIGDYLEKNVSHIQPIPNPSGLAGRPYDTRLIDNQYNREDYPFTSLRKGIAVCFEKLKHPMLDLSRRPTEDIFYMIDLDGTVVDTDRLHYDCYKQAFEQHEVELCDWNTYESIASLEQHCKDTLGEKYDSMKKLKNDLFYKTPTISFLPGAENFIRWLIQTKQNFVIVTNTSRQTVEFFQSKLALLKEVSQWITRDDVIYAKPHQECYELAKKRFWKNEAYILGIENTMTGFQSLQKVTPLIYMICQADSYTYKQLQPYDVYCIPTLDHLQSKASFSD